MGEKAKEVLKLQFNKRLRLEFHGASITSDAGLLACRELDEVLGLYVVSESGTKWAFEVTDTLETTALLPGDSIIVPSYL